MKCIVACADDNIRLMLGDITISYDKPRPLKRIKSAKFVDCNNIIINTNYGEDLICPMYLCFGEPPLNIRGGYRITDKTGECNIPDTQLKNLIESINSVEVQK